MFRCPVPNCNYTTTTLWGLVNHARTCHSGDQCPICGARCKNMVKHLQMKSKDIKHASLYFLLTNRNGRRTSRTIDEIREKVMRYITVQEVVVKA